MDADYTGKFLTDVAGPADHPQAATNDKILSRIYEAAIHGDYAALAQNLAPDVELQITGCGPMDGHWHGVSEVATAVETNFQRVIDQKPVMERMVVQGNAIAVMLNETGSFRDGARPYHIRAVQWFTFEDGKLKNMQQIGSIQA